MPEQNLAKLLIILGSIAVIAGLVLLFKDQIPGLQRLGHLPGDLHFETKNVKVYFPLATSLLLSVILSLIFWLFRSR